MKQILDHLSATYLVSSTSGGHLTINRLAVYCAAAAVFVLGLALGAAIG